MSHENAFGFALSDVARRLKLRTRYAPYWQVTEYGRAVGYQSYPSGQSYWVARVRLENGNYRQTRLALTEDTADVGDSGLSFDQARDAAERWFARQRRGVADTRPIGDRETLIICPIGTDYTIGHALQSYVEWKRVAAARSHFVTVVSLINYHIVPKLAPELANEFNQEKLRYFITEILETLPKRGNQPKPPRRPIGQMTEEELRKRKKTVNTLIGILKNALQMAWESGAFENDRAWRCLRRLPNIDRPRILHLSRPECLRLLEECAPDLKRLVLGALYTGCRATELLRMRVSHVGRDGPGVYILPVKTYRPRFVFLPDEGLSFFEGLIAGKSPSDPVFVRDDGRAWRGNHRHPYKAAVRRANLPEEFTFHGLRHTYASQLIQAGAPLIVISEQLGHANTDTVGRTYGHMSPQIRESEIQQRFTSLTSVPVEIAKARRRPYAQIIL